MEANTIPYRIDSDEEIEMSNLNTEEQRRHRRLTSTTS